MSQPADSPTTAAVLSGVRPTWVRWHIVALLMAYSFVSWFNRMNVTVADKPIMEEFHLSSTEIGIIDSSLLLAYAICMTPGGWFIDRFGPRTALAVMGFGMALFVAATGFAGHAVLGAGLAFASFLVIRALIGTFMAPMYPGSGKLVSHWMPFARRSWANGLITGSALVGVASAHVAFGYLVRGVGWRAAFVLAGALTGLLALLWTWYAADGPERHPAVNDAERRLIEAGRPAREAAAPGGPAHGTWRHLLRNRSLVLLTISYAAVGYFEYLFNFCSEYYFKQVLQMPEAEGQRYSAYANLAQAVAMPVGGLLTDLLVRRLGYRWGRAFMPVAGMLGSAGTLFAVTFTHDPEWTLFWFVLANFAIGATEGSFWSTAIELGGRQGGTGGGIVNTGGNLGGVLAPYATRGLGDLFHGDWRPGFYVGSLVCLVGVVLWAWIDPAEQVAEDR